MKDDKDFEQLLQQDAAELKRLMREDTGLKDYLSEGFNSRFNWIMKIAYVLAVVFTFCIFYTGYQFLTVAAEQQVFWGVLLILAFQAQVATKIWIFMETGRNHTAREIRKLELRLAQRQSQA